MIVIVTKQKRFINANILETLKDSPDAPLSLKVLEERVHKLPREGGSLQNVVGSKELRSGRVNISVAIDFEKRKKSCHGQTLIMNVHFYCLLKFEGL